MVDLPVLGAGVSFRREWRWDVVRHRERLGAVEVIPEDIAGPRAVADLRLIRAAVPVLLHGIGLSLGGVDALDPARLAHWAQVVEAVDPPWVSEHIAFTRAGGVEAGHLLPLPFTREAVDTIARNVHRLRAVLPGVPVLLENIAYTISLPGAELTEAEFVNAVIESTDCGLLLDLENVHANAINHAYDAIAYLNAMPLERVVEVHLAGGVWDGETYADTHTRAVPQESWALLEWLAQRAPLRAVIIERDDDLPRFEDLLTEVTRATTLLDDARRSAARAGR